MRYDRTRLSARRPDCVSCGTSPPPCVCLSGETCIQISQSCSACASFTCVTSANQPVFPVSTAAANAQLPNAASTLSVSGDSSSSTTHHDDGAIIGGSVGGGLALLALLLAMTVYGVVLRRRKMRGMGMRTRGPVHRRYGAGDDSDSTEPALMRESERGFY
ncbi:unnamed protein product [Peniophora sp. CBMAI 1063]|nr:unnamed protein product [Peniophora sp. CBMAI 1063]